MIQFIFWKWGCHKPTWGWSNEFNNYPICPNITIDPFNISDRLKNLDGNKLIGQDNIHPYDLEQCAISFSFPLCILYQKSIDTGTVPLLWKQANIIPVHKYGSKLLPTNYRGISLTSVLCKFLEKIVGWHFHKHLSYIIPNP